MIRIKIKKNHPLKQQKRLRNKARLRKKIFGTQEVPRLNVFRSSKHIYAQLIDDHSKKTLCAFSSLKMKDKVKPKEKAKKVGEVLAQKAKEKKIKQVVFDRGGFIYHGRIQSLAEGARASGLKF